MKKDTLIFLVEASLLVLETTANFTDGAIVMEI